jgi:hypothetical protein
MLTRDELVGLYRSLSGRKVLSAYIDAGQTDPAERRAWSTALDGGFADERRRVQADAPDDLTGFDAARARIDGALAGEKAFLHGRAWVGFSTADDLVYAESVAVPMPDLVRWEDGIRVAPYVRALKQARVVVAAMADSRKARVFTYRDGAIEEVLDLVADRDFGDLSDSATSKRAGTHSGSRGETGTDVARRLKDLSAARMQTELLDELEKLTGREGFLVLGGTTEVVTALIREGDRFGSRWIERPSMHLAMSEAEVRDEIEEAASELTRRTQEAFLDEVIDAAKSRGHGCLGVQRTMDALREGRVDTLLLTRGFREREDDVADHLVGTAFEQGGWVEELSEAGAERLDAEGEGVGARLRYAN